MPTPRLLIIAAIALLSLLAFSIWEQHRELTNDEFVDCLDPRLRWFNQTSTWSGIPFFSPRCQQPSTSNDNNNIPLTSP
jgi:hypothetical protein